MKPPKMKKKPASVYDALAEMEEKINKKPDDEATESPMDDQMMMSKKKTSPFAKK